MEYTNRIEHAESGVRSSVRALDSVRSLLSSVEDKLGVRSFTTKSLIGYTEGYLTAPSSIDIDSSLCSVLPGGLIVPGVVNLTESWLWLVLISKELVKADKWVVFLGLDGMNWDYLYENPKSLEKIVVVPSCDQLDATVVAAALEGFDAVILGDISLSTHEEKILQKKAEQRNSLIVAMRWKSKALTLSSTLQKINGLNRGYGFISCIEYLLESDYGQATISLSGQNILLNDAKEFSSSSLHLAEAR